MNEMERTFAEGLPNKTFIIRFYSELYAEFLPEDNFYTPYRGSLSPLWPGMEFETPENEQLRWVDGDGPGYSRERAEEILSNRYAGAIKPIRLTLPHLLAYEEFRRLICQLKEENYLDWEILLLIINICVDHRLRIILPPTAPPDEQIKTMETMLHEEREDDVGIPVSVFTQDRISLQKKIQIATIAKTWGLELHKQTPDFIAIERFLDTRYHNSEDDIEHEDFFGGI